MLHIQCERSWVRGSGEWDTGKIIAYMFLLGWIGALIAWSKSKPKEEFGRDTWITVPIRISTQVRTRALRMRRQSKLRAVLRKTPIYSRLLQEFPGATVTPMQLAEHGGEREPPMTRVLKS